MKNFLTALLLLVLPFAVWAQTTDVINYQAIVRDADGNVSKNTPITLRVSIIAGAASGAVVYEETHDITTDEKGYFFTHIGDGETTDNYSAINWGGDLHFLKTEYDFNDGSTFLLAGLSELTSVAYANYANNYDETDPDFNVSVAKGITEADTVLWNNNISSWSNNENGIKYMGGEVHIGNRNAYSPDGDGPVKINYEANAGGGIILRNYLRNKNTSIDLKSDTLVSFTMAVSGSERFINWDKNTAMLYTSKDDNSDIYPSGLVIGHKSNSAPIIFVDNESEVARFENGNFNIDGTIESKSGGIIFPDGTIQTTSSSFDGDMNDKKITNLASPSDPKDAVNKAYVDELIGRIEELENIVYGNTPIEIPTDSLVLYLPFNGNADDQSGNGNNGTINGTTLIEDRFGIADNAYYFDGTNDWIEIAHDPSINFSLDESYTISFWIKADHNSGSWGGDIMSKWKNSFDPYPYRISYGLSATNIWQLNTNRYIGNLPQDSTRGQTIITPEIKTGYHHVVAIYNFEEMRVYVDDVLVISGMNEMDSGNVSNTYNLYLGRRNGRNDRFFKGVIDDIRIYRRELDYRERKALYNEGR